MPGNSLHYWAHSFLAIFSLRGTNCLSSEFRQPEPRTMPDLPDLSFFTNSLRELPGAKGKTPWPGDSSTVRAYA